MAKPAIIAFSVVALGTPAIFALAPYSSLMEKTALAMLRPVRFAARLKDRDKGCSVGDVWAAGSDDFGRRTQQIREASKLVTTQENLALIATPAGRFWIPARDFSSLAEELSEQGLDVYGPRLRAGDIVLDCGANVGVYTRTALARGAAMVIAIEPGPEALMCLRRNFEKEIQEKRVIIYPKGVWDHDGTLRLTTDPKLASTASSVALDRGPAGPEVSLTTIDAIVSELQLPRVDFIKMDIEGSESHALMGAARTLAAFKPRLAISMEHKQTDPVEIPSEVKRLNPGYTLGHGACGATTGRVQPEVLYAW